MALQDITALRRGSKRWACYDQRGPGTRCTLTAVAPLQIVLLAFAPGLFIVLYVWLRDNYCREDPRSVLRTFAWGCLAIVPAMLVETLLIPGADRLHELSTGALLMALFLVIGPVEEFFKFLVVWRRDYHRPDFAEPMDGLVYSTSSAMGFASMESFLYLVREGPQAAPARILLALPGHLFFSGIWGYYLGLKKLGGASRGHLVWALLWSSFLHGFYNFLVIGQAGSALLAIPLMVLLGSVWFKELDVALDRSPFRPGSPVAPVGDEAMVSCPSCGAPTAVDADACQHCGLAMPPAGSDESGREPGEE